MNPITGSDLPRDVVEKIASLFEGSYVPENPKEDAQLRELAFWRWVAYEGYEGKNPEQFVAFQRDLMRGCFDSTGWDVEMFSKSTVFELGCGPLGMIETIPAASRWAFDPNNEYYGSLFGKVREKSIVHLSDVSQMNDVPLVDLGICFNVLDHTDDAAHWFRLFFSKIRPGGRFILQVNTVKEDFPRTEEHCKMHPSPLTREQVESLVAEVSASNSRLYKEEPSPDNEFYLMIWGKKLLAG
ncbi:hypothetical protein H9K76_06065 [Diaphorobacter ruginosibacter]|uniref:Class I SAM-dependent methyltransferase n=1 Tax=Diaphorobacter ruginosibacter TaxID=1715720 RepID=A0A7G9RS31_9BURK|nr:hypothetical protein [Diaphorobacter ruginosibacter]QNN58406.1 hypothetical protein H9K76_06065 [Diaphorobacter ruginosibacter]